MSFQIQGTIGVYVPTTNVWDVSELYSVNVNSPEFKELLVRLYQYINNIAISVNLRDAGYYDIMEYVNGQQFFPNQSFTSGTAQSTAFRQVFRKAFNFGALPNTGTKTLAHGINITNKTTFTRIYGTASDTTGNNYIPLPYASPTLVNNIELKVDATNITIITGSNRSNFDTTYIILEYMQS